MSPADDKALLERLRKDLELKGEILKALRAEHERDSESVRDQAALLAAVSAGLHNGAAALVLLLAERDLPGAQRAAEQLAAGSADLADYTGAKVGELALAREPVHLRQLLSRLAVRCAVTLRVGDSVPERVLADPARLAKLLSGFIGDGLEAAGSGSVSLEAASNRADPGAVSHEVTLTLHRAGGTGGSGGGGGGQPGPRSPSPMTRLRAMLAQCVYELMGATLTRAPNGIPAALATLRIPFQSAADQGHTGIFRLAVAEAPGTSATAAVRALPDLSPPAEADAAIDLMFLDRQLGSLASVILARAAPAFIAQAQRRMTDLHVAHDIEDLKRLRTLAHAWKGSALCVGARGLAALLDAMEKQAAAGRLPGPGAVWQLRGELDHVVRALGDRAPRRRPT
ncbi:MAG TPA: Hpt domain-containing protein [Steroidobacteraceae bacterium]